MGQVARQHGDEGQGQHMGFSQEYIFLDKLGKHIEYQLIEVKIRKVGDLNAV